ncbi:Tryptophanyl-tRNA synthetase [Caballeronia sordidicola]|uniref:Tryptophanyl-tRNA synthetase n=1 Tax=Caballeronia sordidicola TaxID=196367 RepID=A0A242MGC4_CABSO|nr:Tryptophanyl-tRNA synthetase [Caballeronia sordidicola]
MGRGCRAGQQLRASADLGRDCRAARSIQCQRTLPHAHGCGGRGREPRARRAQPVPAAAARRRPCADGLAAGACIDHAVAARAVRVFYRDGAGHDRHPDAFLARTAGERRVRRGVGRPESPCFALPIKPCSLTVSSPACGLPARCT